MGSIKPYAYSHNLKGAQVKPLSNDGRKVSVFYNGPLAQSAGGQVYLHCGSGDTNNWSSVSDFPMEHRSNGWELSVGLKTGNSLNFCFRDSHGNWDNNNGANWLYRITE
ncbi:carbohydrate-binding protein [Pelotomaculum propionicicum]|uniref:Carbohydrate binding module family 25 domain-containing protein n=1 Tax=Pelotomaculum propionicicum TaxID=258475 RepID=A0A4Y7RYH1_9FIRM|nr:carbohydrate-binding protein [Pelotomaculum propionicicum]NLI14522.1 hypothetical protein [Peptococcaceae bacterium]TEB13692.1 hypothetical protein Pmgp_00095 [Pelotomaculum propionicicum]